MVVVVVVVVAVLLLLVVAVVGWRWSCWCACWGASACGGKDNVVAASGVGSEINNPGVGGSSFALVHGSHKLASVEGGLLRRVCGGFNSRQQQ